MADLVLLQTIITGYAALLQTIQVWQTTKDRSLVLMAYQQSTIAAANSPAIATQAKALGPIVPADIAYLIYRRFNNCWTNYHMILDPGNDVPEEKVDQAERDLIKCACREAKRLFDLTHGNLPEGPLRDFWELHRCSELV